MTRAIKVNIAASALLVVLFCALTTAAITWDLQRGHPADDECGLLCECSHDPTSRWLVCGAKP